MDKATLKHLIDVASGREAADFCVRNCKVIDVFNKDTFEADVFISDGYFAGFGDRTFPKPMLETDACGMYLAPGFIDSHLHLESSHLSPAEYARLSVPHGTSAIVADPHEICNVCGIDGLDYMLKATENLPLSVYFQLPSCVPATPFENSGAVLTANEIATRIDNPRILGLGELMNYVGAAAGDSSILDKIITTRNAGKEIDGHCPGLSGILLDAYCAGGVKNDHECTNVEEAREKIRRGMYILLRRGSVCHDLDNLISLVSERNSRWFLMCSDDCQAKTLLEEGHIDNNIRVAVKKGIDPITAICMATINAATAFKLNDRGAVAPGYRADFVLFDSLDDINPKKVFYKGNLVAENGKCIVHLPHVSVSSVSGKVNVKDCSAERFDLKLNSRDVRTIKIIPGAIITSVGQARVNIDENGYWVRNEDDIVKVAVVERHHGTGNIGLALLEGFGLKGGAVATSVAHDSHNIIVAGDSSKSMEIAVRELIRMGGGMTVVKGESVVESVGYEIAGLMTDRQGDKVAKALTSIHKASNTYLGIHDDVDPFMTLSFMSLPVIPSIKVTDLGLFDVDSFSFVPVEITPRQ